MTCNGITCDGNNIETIVINVTVASRWHRTKSLMKWLLNKKIPSQIMWINWSKTKWTTLKVCSLI